MERTVAALGRNWWPYGAEANGAELDAICHYSHEQHLSARRVSPDELFHPSLATAPPRSSRSARLPSRPGIRPAACLRAGNR